jgi:hypothetical protein
MLESTTNKNALSFPMGVTDARWTHLVMMMYL